MTFSSTDPSPDVPDPVLASPVAATPSSGLEPATGGVNRLRCEVCGAAIAADQRYCVECGNHRVGVNDPAASFMNRSNARGGQRAGRAVVVSSRRGRVLTALALVLIPIAVGVGVLIGRSSNNQDAKLERAIAHEKAQIVTVQSANAKVVTVAASGATRTRPKQSTSGSKTKSTSQSGSKAGKPANSGSTTTSGSVGAASSASQAKQSAKIVKKLQSTNGLSYLNPLPSQVGGG